MSLSKLNPLDIPLITRNVFRYLDRKNLLRCRQVNKSWNSEACDLLALRMKTLPELVLRNGRAVTSFIAAFENSMDGIAKIPYSLCFSIDAVREGEFQITREDLEKILNFGPERIIKLALELSRPRVTKVLPFRAEYYDEEEGRTIVQQLGEVLDIIFNRCTNVQTFEISRTFHGTLSISPADWQRTLNRYEGRSLPKLRDIRVAINWVLPAWQHKYSIVVNALMETVIGSAVQLRSLKFDGEYGTTEQSLMRSIISKLCSSKLEKLKTYLFALQADSLLALSTHPCNFPFLTAVRFEMSESITESHLKLFLERYSNSLSKLHLENVAMNLCFPMGITMRMLNRLKLQGFCGTIDWTKLPKLKQVVFDNCLLREIVSSVVTSPSHCKMDYLSIEGNQRQESLKEFHWLFVQVAPYVFPNLVELYLSHLSKLPIDVIFSECQRLQRLKLWGYMGVTDTALCGMHPSLLKAMWPAETNFKYDEDDVQKTAYYRALVRKAQNVRHIDYFNNGNRKSYIGNLTELRQLVIQDLDAEFSEKAVLYGIINCEKLEVLVLQSDYLCEKRSARIIRQADLFDLATLEINGINIPK